MNQFRLRWSPLPAVLGILMIAGCSSNKSQSETPATSSQAAPQAAPSSEAEHGESAATVTPAATVEGMWTQIAEEQGKLSAVIQNGQLKDVHHLAFGIRDLVVALADRATAAVPESAASLNGMAEQVKASATRLDELGDAGNLSGTQAEFANLEKVLASIKTVTRAK